MSKEKLARTGIKRVAFEVSLFARTSGHILKESLLQPLHPTAKTIIHRDCTTGEIKITRETAKPK